MDATKEKIVKRDVTKLYLTQTPRKTKIFWTSRIKLRKMKRTRKLKTI